MNNFEMITRNPRALGEFLSSLSCIEGPWDTEFHARYCAECSAENCDKCRHEARSNPFWWLLLDNEQSDSQNTETHPFHEIYVNREDMGKLSALLRELSTLINYNEKSRTVFEHDPSEKTLKITHTTDLNDVEVGREVMTAQKCDDSVENDILHTAYCIIENDTEHNKVTITPMENDGVIILSNKAEIQLLINLLTDYL